MLVSAMLKTCGNCFLYRLLTCESSLLLSLYQTIEKLRKVQNDYEGALRDKLIASSQLQAVENSKTEALVELSRAQEGRTAAVAELAAKEAVANEKIRAAESSVADLRVRLKAVKTSSNYPCVLSV